MADKGALAAFFQVEIADDAERDSADKADKQIFHRVVEANVEIAAEAEVDAVDSGGLDILDDNGDVAVRLVKHDAGNGVHHGVFLHIKQEDPVGGKLDKFPQHADGHRKAEGRDGHIER